MVRLFREGAAALRRVETPRSRLPKRLGNYEVWGEPVQTGMAREVGPEPTGNPECLPQMSPCGFKPSRIRESFKTWFRMMTTIKLDATTPPTTKALEMV